MGFQQQHASIKLAALIFMSVMACNSARAEFTLFPGEVDLGGNMGFVYDDNVTRAKLPADMLSDRAISVNGNASLYIPLSEHTRGLISAAVGTEKFSNFSGLNHTYEGLQGEYQYRGSAEFDAPTYALFFKGYFDQYVSEIRGGSRMSLGISYRKPVTDRIRFFAAIARNQRNAKSEAFSLVDNAVRFNVDYSIGRKHAVYLGAELKQGDIVSTGMPSLENIDIADVYVQDSAFPGVQLYAYRFKGTTSLYTLGYNFGLNSRNSLDFSWRMIESRANERPAFATSPASYIVNQYSITYLIAF